MKRSEMVKILEDHISIYISEDWASEKLARELLDRLEWNGMLPPGYMKPIDGYPLVPGDFKNENGIWCTPGINEWEPEDASSSD